MRYPQDPIPQNLPAQYSRQAWSQNTPMSVPGPARGGMPVGYWASSNDTITWTNKRAQMPTPIQARLDAGDITHFATWGSPLFDLRPQLQGFTSQGQQGNPNTTRRGTPVWVGGGTGAGSRLFVQVQIHSQDNDFVNTTNFDDVTVLTFERGHVVDAGKAGRISSVQDITANFSLDGNRYIILAFIPFGEGMPIRFWQQVVWFTKKQTSGIPVPFSLQGALY